MEPLELLTVQLLRLFALTGGAVGIMTIMDMAIRAMFRD